MKKTFYIALAGLVLLSACRKEQQPDIQGGDAITFYIKSTNEGNFGTKSLIEDTSDLLAEQPKLYVTDVGAYKTFENTGVDYNSGGIWKSKETWTKERDYTFFGYVMSAGKGNITPSNYGRTVTIKEPEYYAEETGTNDDYWADYLLSYRVNANGTVKPLVKLELERVTTCVELYLAQSVGSKIRIKQIAFSGVYTSAEYIIQSHASELSLPGIYNMKNVWNIPSDSYSNLTTYEWKSNDTNGTELNDVDGGSRFQDKYRMMKFLTVHQKAENHKLTITYTSEENGVVTGPHTAEFDLNDTAQPLWTRGHKTRYYINFDTSLELYTTIVPWRTVDEIEVTILPPLKPGEPTE